MPNKVKRRYPAFFSGFEETENEFTTEAEFWKIEWVREIASYPAFMGYFWEPNYDSSKTMLISRSNGVKVPRNYVVAYLDHPPDFLPEHKRSDYGFGKFPPWWRTLVFTKTCKRVANDIWRGTIGRIL